MQQVNVHYVGVCTVQCALNASIFNTNACSPFCLSIKLLTAYAPYLVWTSGIKRRWNGWHFVITANKEVKMLHLLFFSRHHLSTSVLYNFLRVLLLLLLFALRILKNWIKNRLAAPLKRCAMMHYRDKQFFTTTAGDSSYRTFACFSVFFFFSFIYLHIHSCAQSLFSRHISHMDECVDYRV